MGGTYVCLVLCMLVLVWERWARWAGRWEFRELDAGVVLGHQALPTQAAQMLREMLSVAGDGRQPPENHPNLEIGTGTDRLRVQHGADSRIEVNQTVPDNFKGLKPRGQVGTGQSKRQMGQYCSTTVKCHISHGVVICAICSIFVG